METIELVIQVGDEQVQEALIAELSELEFDGFEQRDNVLLAFITADRYNQEKVAALLQQKALPFEVSEVAEQNWNALWESNFEPVLVGDFCMVRAHFHPPVPAVTYDILITPKMSFGTGHHATTYMMLDQMKDIDFAGKSVVDFGTGTGVLAILAAKMGARSVWAIDNDDWSIENACENAGNNATTAVRVEKADGLTEGQVFDVVVANINRNVLAENARAISESVVPNGTLLLSGLLVADKKFIVDLYENSGFKLLKTAERNNWICLRLLKV